MPNATACGAVFSGAGEPFALRTYPVTPPAPGTARLRLVASGICGTDAHFHRGALAAHTPATLGHEFVGVVDALHPDDARTAAVRVGDVCIVDIALPCGDCLLCLNGDAANCVRMGVTNGGDPDTAPYFHGGFSEVTYAPLTALVRVPNTLDPMMAAVFACAGPTACHAFSLAARANMDFASVSAAVVQGLGPVGLFAVLFLRAAGVRQIVAVTAREHPARAALAHRLGATHCLSLQSGGEHAVTTLLAELTGGLGADLCYEASGNPAAVPQGLSWLRNRGVYLIPGQYSNSGGVSIEPQQITFKALQIFGSSQYALSDVAAYLAFLQKHPDCHADIRALASLYPLSQINAAFADVHAGKPIKALLIPDAETSAACHYNPDGIK